MELEQQEGVLLKRPSFRTPAGAAGDRIILSDDEGFLTGPEPIGACLDEVLDRPDMGLDVRQSLRSSPCRVASAVMKPRLARSSSDG